MKLFINKKIVDSTQISGGLETIVELNQIDNYSIQVEWTGDVSGTVALAASNEDVKDPSIMVPTHFVTIASTVVSLGSTSGAYMYNVEGAAYRFIKLDISAASGTGTATAWYHGKGL